RAGGHRRGVPPGHEPALGDLPPHPAALSPAGPHGGAHHPHGGHPEAVRYGFRPHARRPRRLDGADQPLRPARRLPRLRRRRRIRPGGAAADPLHRPRAVVYPHLLPGDRGSMSQPSTPAATYTVQRKRRWTAASIGEMAALIFLIVIILLPLYWMVSTSLKTANDT